jgi:hypothetical protein
MDVHGRGHREETIARSLPRVTSAYSRLMPALPCAENPIVISLRLKEISLCANRLREFHSKSPALRPVLSSGLTRQISARSRH